MPDIEVRKTEVNYELSKPFGDSYVTIYLTVHLNNDERRMSITGKNDKFEFRKSDPYLMMVLNELYAKAIDIAQDEHRVQPKDKK